MDDKVGVEITSETGVGIVAFKSSLVGDSEKIEGFCKEVTEFIKEKRPKGIVFDFEAVRFFSSQVLGMLLDIRAKMEGCDGEVVISSISPQLHKIFEITNLDSVFRFFPDNKSAVREASKD